MSSNRIPKPVTPRKRSIDDVLNHTLDRNIPPKPVKAKKQTEIEEFDIETKKLYYEFCEKQRQEMVVFERNYFLDNIDDIDDDANFQSVCNLDERQKLEENAQDIKHKFNMKKEELSKKLRKEETDFWTQRNGERAQILNRLDKFALHGFTLRPRSVSSSAFSSPVASRAISPLGSPCDSGRTTPSSRSYANHRHSMPLPYARYEKPKSPSGFFLPKCTSISRQNKIGIFPKSRSSSTVSPNKQKSFDEIDVIRSKVNKTSSVSTPQKSKRPNLTVDTSSNNLSNDD